MKTRVRMEEVALVVLYVGLGIISALLWHRIVTHSLRFLPYLVPEAQGRLELMANWHSQLVSGQAPAPNQYRILTPWFVEYVVSRLLPGLTIYGAYAVARGLFVGLALICLDRYLRTWFSRGAAAAGALFLAAVIPFTYFFLFQESDPLNLLVIVLAFLLVVRNQDRWLAPLVVLGTLNRETALLVPAVYALGRWGETRPRTVVLHTALLTACWALVFAGLRVGYGPRAGYTEAVMWAGNVASGLPTLFALLCFGVVWVLPWLAPKDAPPFLRRARWLVPPFVLLHYIVAVVAEVRLFLPLAPILIPLSWWVLFPEARQRAAAVRGAARRGVEGGR